MIAAYIAFLVLGVIAFVFSAKLAFLLRIFIALVVFIIPSIILTIWVARVGDRPMPDAITVVPEPPETDKTNSKDPDT